MKTASGRTYKRATTPAKFALHSMLTPDVSASVVLDEGYAAQIITDRQYNWFIDHADQWTRWLHANNRKWKTFLEANDRKQLYAFIRQWRNSFLQDPETYIDRHPLADIR